MGRKQKIDTEGSLKKVVKFHVSADAWKQIAAWCAYMRGVLPPGERERGGSVAAFFEPMIKLRAAQMSGAPIVENLPCPFDSAPCHATFMQCETCPRRDVLKEGEK